MSFDEIMAWNRKNNKGFKEPSAEYLARARADFDKSRAAETPEYRARRAAADKREKDAAAAAMARKANARADAAARSMEGEIRKNEGSMAERDRADAAARSMEGKIRKNEGSMAERDAARTSMKDDAFRAMLQGKQRTSAIGGGMSEEPFYPMTAEETRNAASEMNATADDGMRRGGKVKKMAKGGKAEAFEGSAKDMAQDKKLAKKRSMSLKAWEKSSADEKHDTQRSMKGLKMGGKIKKMASGGPSGDDAMAEYRDRQRAKETAPVPRPRPPMQDSAKMPVGLRAKRQEAEMEHLDRQLQRAYGLQDKSNAREVPLNVLQVLSAFPKDSAGKDFYNGQNRRDKNMGYALEESVLDAMGRVGRKGPANVPAMKKGGKAEMHAKGCKCMACGGMAKYAMGGSVSTAQDGMKKPLRPKPTAMAKGGKVGMTFGKPLPGTKVSSQKIRSTVSTAGANMKKDGMKGQLRAKASGAKTSSMMKPLGMTKMAKGGKVRGAGIAQRGTKFIGEV
jgi:hypothetical protein